MPEQLICPCCDKEIESLRDYVHNLKLDEWVCCDCDEKNKSCGYVKWHKDENGKLVSNQFDEL